MTKTPLAVATLVLLLSGTLFANEATNWAGTPTNPEIQYRSQVYDDAQACVLEFRDQDQGRGYTTFDAAVDYKSTEVNPEGQPITKTDRENIVTAPTHTGSSRISKCSGVIAVHVTFVQRH